MKQKISQYLVLALTLFCTLVVGIPVADVPIKVYDSAAAVIPIFALLAVVGSWLYLVISDRQKRHFLVAFGLNLLVVIFLSCTLNDIGMCYEYYLHGGG